MSPTSGQGAATVTFSVRASSFDSYTHVEVRGLSGQNPSGLHRIVWGNPSTEPFIR
ncbi:MAG: hypothetical protein ACRD09_00805 [Vicinamibacterales bacterium]